MHLNYAYPDLLARWMSESTYGAVLEAVGGHVPKGSRVLDVGCGRGEVMAGLAGAGYEAHGCDIEPWCVEAGRAHGSTEIPLRVRLRV